MIFGLLRRLFGLACFVLVVYAAITVPIGRRTTWGHLVAIFTAPPAREAAEDLEGIATKAWQSRAAKRDLPAENGREHPKKP